ncbi:hypothetical protein D3C81_1885420 [compost metagenome]
MWEGAVPGPCRGLREAPKKVAPERARGHLGVQTCLRGVDEDRKVQVDGSDLTLRPKFNMLHRNRRRA